MTARFTAYITKYALTDGVKTVEVEDCFDISHTMVKEVGKNFVTYHGNDWYRNPSDAIQRAHQMRNAKIISLRKSLAKIERLMFSYDHLTDRIVAHDSEKEIVQ